MAHVSATLVISHRFIFFGEDIVQIWILNDPHILMAQFVSVGQGAYHTS